MQYYFQIEIKFFLSNLKINHFNKNKNIINLLNIKNLKNLYINFLNKHFI